MKVKEHYNVPRISFALDKWWCHDSSRSSGVGGGESFGLGNVTRNSSIRKDSPKESASSAAVAVLVARLLFGASAGQATSRFAK